jgi:hypothetical protein
MERLARDHSQVVELLAQLQAQYGNTGKVSSTVAYLNIGHLRTELYERGWNSRLAEDGKTVVLFPRE